MKRIIYILIITMVMTTGCQGSVNKGINTTIETPEKITLEEIVVDEKLSNIRDIYGTDLRSKYDTLKRIGLIDFEYNNLGEVMRSDEAYGSIVRLDGYTYIEPDVRADSLSINDFMYEVLISMYYDVDYDNSIQLAKDLGLADSVMEKYSDDYYKEVTYEDSIQILYSALFTPVNSKGVEFLSFEEEVGSHAELLEGTISPMGLIASRNDVDIFSGEVVVYADYTSMEEGASTEVYHEGDSYLKIDGELESKLTSVIGNLTDYYRILYNGEETNVSVVGVDYINVDYSEGLMWVYFKFKVEGRGVDYETTQNIYMYAEDTGSNLKIGIYDDGLARGMLANAVIDRKGYELISSTEAEGSNYILVDEEMNTMGEYEIIHSDITNVLIVNQIDN